ASVIDELEAGDVPVTKVSQQTYAANCGAFFDAVDARVVAQRSADEPVFGPTFGSARRQKASEGWRWQAKDSTSDITPLVAATLALGALPAAGGREHDRSVVVDLDGWD
ncbi:MAG TPA: hypothetical protein VMS14_04945, partial [Ilumatobacteraceae bacterium]|nr:hypothetical protein [Ilumatobacteraceae bacterium]